MIPVREMLLTSTFGEALNDSMSGAADVQAREAIRVAESDPHRAIRLASGAADLARRARDGATGAVAARALGLAAMQLQDIDGALAHLRRAVRLGLRAGSPGVAAEARMSLAGVLSREGRPQAALRVLDQAITVLTGADHARGVAQRGAIMHQIGRLEDADASYRAALPGLRRAGDVLWTQRILGNRGVLHAQRNEFAAAEEDLHAAEELCVAHELTLSLAYVHQNLGFVHARRGDGPSALRYFDRAEARFRELGCPLGELLTDRAELLLSLRLFAEARESAAAAVAGFEQESRSLAALPEARLVLARAAVMAGDVPAAVEQASHAIREFTRQHRPEWAALGALALLSAERAGPAPPRITVGRLEGLAETVARAWPGAAVYARLTAGLLAAERHQHVHSRRLLGQAAAQRDQGPVTARALAWHAAALLRAGDDDRVGAVRAARAGLRLLDEHVAALGATDLRASAAGNRVELAALGLRMAVRDGKAHRIFQWAELGRASHLLHPPARPSEDPVLAELVGALRATMAQIAELRSDGRADSRLQSRQVTLERAIRDRDRVTTSRAERQAVRPPTVADVGARLGDAALLEFFHDDGTLHVVTIVDGRVRTQPLCPAADVAAQVDRLLFALRRLCRVHVDARSVAAARLLFDHAANELGRLVVDGVRGIGDRPLVFSPTGPLQRVPWAVLPACVGRPVSVTPSAALLRPTGEPAPPAHERVTVAAGPGLTGCRTEAEAIGALYGVKPLLDAGVDRVSAALSGSRLAHLATHGALRADNPLFSSLRFSDGPLMAYDLNRLPAAPETMVLAACDTARPVVLAGDEIMGFAATVLAHGTRRLVAPVVAVPDVDTAPLMIAFHESLMAGASAAEALATAQHRAADDHPHGMGAVARFVCVGA